MSGSFVRMALQCPLCGHRPPLDSVIEAFQLHCQVEHDTDDVKLDLRAVCECGAAMDYTHTEREGPHRERDHFRCVCGKRGAVRRHV